MLTVQMKYVGAFKNLVVMFRNKGKTERENMRSAAAMRGMYWSVIVKKSIVLIYDPKALGRD